jgi:hypothetical protein
LDRLELLERAEAIHTRVNEKLAAAKSGDQSESFKWNAIPNQSTLFSQYNRPSPAKHQKRVRILDQA